MSHPPLMRFLGLDEHSSDRSILGLSPHEISSSQLIASALDQRLADLDRHPGARTPAAAAVRRRLGEAAGRLMASLTVAATESNPPFMDPAEELRRLHAVTPAPPPPIAEQLRRRSEDMDADAPDEEEVVVVENSEPIDTRIQPLQPGTGTVATLTEFDRTVLAILVGSGGWNASSRGRLIGLAAQRGLKPAMLMRIVSGLAELLQGGEFETVAGTNRAIDVAQLPTVVPREPTLMEVRMNQMSEILSSEFRGESSGSRIRLGIFFSMIAILLIGLFTALLMMPSPVVEATKDAEALELAREQLIAAAGAAGEEVVDPNASGFRTEPSVGSIDEIGVIPASWTEVPGFDGDRRHDRELVLAQDASAWVKALSVLARKASLPQATGNNRIFREYDVFLDDAGRCWPLLDPVLRGQLIEAMASPVANGVSRDIRADLVNELGDRLGQLRGPLDVWRASWVAGLLGTIREDPLQSEAIRILASELLSLDLGARRKTRGSEEQPFAVTTGRKLDAMVADLFALASNEQSGAYDAWENWIQAQRAIRKGALLDVAFLDAIMLVLDQGYALERPGMPLNILARLLSELDFSARSHDPELMRVNMRSWFESPDISSDNLWVLTSLLAQSIDVPWWEDRHVLSPGATSAERLALADLIEASWPQRLPTERPRGIPVPGELLERLEFLHARLLQQGTLDSQTSVLHALLAASRLTAAAESFEAGDLDTGAEELEEANILILSTHEPQRLPIHLGSEPGRSQQRDGAWSEQWKRSSRDISERQSLLRRLKQRTDGDLGPIDAATLVFEVYRGAPRDIRLLAQEVVVDTFANGPNVAMALLNQFESAPLNQDTVDFLLRFSSETLPPLSDENWRLASRLVLARHAFDLHRSSLHDIDQLITAYADVLRSRFERLGGDAYLRNSDPQEIASALVSLFERRAAGRFVAEPIPAPLEELERRRSVRWASANGAAQQLASELAALVDLTTFETGSLRPDLRRELIDGHADLTTRVAVAPDVLRQLLVLEIALGDLIMKRLEVEDGAS
ncbi:MAG: hypothetical protein P8J45_07235 [Phycisphaerales bacterium]|nr:hypothetical protein [Phycisphaerales bacterium]